MITSGKGTEGWGKIQSESKVNLSPHNEDQANGTIQETDIGQKSTANRYIKNSK